MTVLSLLTVPCGCARTSSSAADPVMPPAGQSRPKKLIQYGWGVPDAAELRQNHRQMEQDPFDGIGFRVKGRVPGSGSAAAFYAFRPERIEEAWLAADYEDLRHVRFEKFTDNFIVINAAPGTLDWFDDDHWQIAMHNVALNLDAANIVGCKGVIFDPEIYTLKDRMAPLWRPAALRKDPGKFERFAAQSRLRGRQFIETIGRKMPRAVVLCLILASYPANKVDAFHAPDVSAALTATEYALLPAFLEGMLDGIRPGMTIVDGNEAAYKYRTPIEFFEAYHMISQSTGRLISPENRARYQTQVQVGHGLFLQKTFRGEAAPENKARQFERIVYHALMTSDEYVWIYNEDWFWWPPRLRKLPHGINDAMRNARDRIAGRDPRLLRNLSTEADAPPDRQHRRANVTSLAPGDAPPSVDGDLSDDAWSNALRIGRFVMRGTQFDPDAETRAWITCDAEHLYVAFRCIEPFMTRLRAHGVEPDDAVWEGDSVDVFLSIGSAPEPFHHFIVNPNNVRWDGRGNDPASFDGRWRSAVTKTAGAWDVELAVSWSEMGMEPPSPGTTLRVNLCRARRAGTAGEFCTWSPVAEGFVEPTNFGYLTFR